MMLQRRVGVTAGTRVPALCHAVPPVSKATRLPLSHNIASVPYSYAEFPTSVKVPSHTAASHGRPSVITSAAAGAAGSAQPAPKAGVQQWTVPTYITLWYAFNMIFNILNKTTLNSFPCPWFIGTLQLVASAVFTLLMWATGIEPVPKVSRQLLIALVPVAFFHTVGHISACISFGQMAVSFTHVIKSAEPVLSVALSYPLLGLTYPYYVWLSLIPIVAGCSLSAMKEVSFDWGGFNNAMISNFGMVMRNILSKKLLTQSESISGVSLFGLISMVALLFCAPAAVAFEGATWSAALETAALKLGGWPHFAQLLAASGLFYHLYNQLSYMVLDTGLSAVSLSVGNTMKRIFVVVSSVMFFRNPVSILNWVGSAIAIFGTYLYSLATAKAAEEKKKQRAAASGEGGNN